MPVFGVTRRAEALNDAEPITELPKRHLRGGVLGHYSQPVVEGTHQRGKPRDHYRRRSCCIEHLRAGGKYSNRSEQGPRDGPHWALVLVEPQ